MYFRYRLYISVRFGIRVIHLVSEVKGQDAKDGPFELLAVTFPAGTWGAPKFAQWN
jgi:anthranilate/para-aminobenzoate synthase component I